MRVSVQLRLVLDDTSMDEGCAGSFFLWVRHFLATAAPLAAEGAGFCRCLKTYWAATLHDGFTQFPNNLTSKSTVWQSHPMNKLLPIKAVPLNEVKTTEAR